MTHTDSRAPHRFAEDCRMGTEVAMLKGGEKPAAAMTHSGSMQLDKYNWLHTRACFSLLEDYWWDRANCWSGNCGGAGLWGVATYGLYSTRRKTVKAGKRVDWVIRSARRLWLRDCGLLHFCARMAEQTAKEGCSPRRGMEESSKAG